MHNSVDMLYSVFLNSTNSNPTPTSWLLHPCSRHPLQFSTHAIRQSDQLLCSTWYVVINKDRIKQMSKIALKVGTFGNNCWYDILLYKTKIKVSQVSLSKR